MEAVLKLKHWQVFLVITISIAAVVTQMVMLSAIRFENMDRYDLMMNTTNYVMVAGNLAVIAWVYITGIALWKKLASDEVDANMFRVCMAITAIYTVLLQVMPLNRTIDTLSWAPWIYSYYFVARMLVSVERDELVGFNGSGRTFFAFLFLWISIWWIQPRINKIFSPEWENLNPDTPLDHNLGQEPQR